MPRSTALSSLLPGPATAAEAFFYHPTVGESFEPHRVHQDNEARRSRGIGPIYLPAVIGAQREIDGEKVIDGPKRVYGYLVGRAGTNGDCWPSYERIAMDLGKSKRQVQNDIKFLEKLGLITHDNRAARKSNTYRFIWHPIFERQWTATQMSGKVRSIARFEWQDRADLSGSGLPPNLYKESPQQKAAACGGDSIDPAEVAHGEFVAPTPSGFTGSNSNEVQRDASAVEEVSAALSRNGVAIRAPAEVQALIALARKNAMETTELARFIDHKCRAKSACGDPIRGAILFFRCIPGDVMAFRGALAKTQAEHSPPRLWKDPYEKFSPQGGCNG